jgi:lysophospholipase L1-like esterase
MLARSLLSAVIVVAVAAPSVASDSVPITKPIRIVLVGDSTVASYAKPPKDRPDLTGWGQVFGECFNDRVTVLNHAQSGASSKSFIGEGRWQKALAAKGDYIFVQFGHNDSHLKDGKPAVDPAKDFQDYLRQYIDDARTAGARPILVTPVARRTFVGGKIHTVLQPYADAMLKVGKEKGVPVINLHAASMALFDSLGDQGSADLTASASDRTHFSRKGAVAVAHLVAEAVPVAVPELRPCLKTVARSEPQNESPIKAFCIDFNWGPKGINGFAGPGVWADASPEDQVRWYEGLGANVIQTFAVSCNGYAWYNRSKPVGTFTGNDKNIAVLLRYFHGLPLDFIDPTSLKVNTK